MRHKSNILDNLSNPSEIAVGYPIPQEIADQFRSQYKTRYPENTDLKLLSKHSKRRTNIRIITFIFIGSLSLFFSLSSGSEEPFFIGAIFCFLIWKLCPKWIENTTGIQQKIKSQSAEFLAQILGMKFSSNLPDFPLSSFIRHGLVREDNTLKTFDGLEGKFHDIPFQMAHLTREDSEGCETVLGLFCIMQGRTGILDETRFYHDRMPEWYEQVIAPEFTKYEIRDQKKGKSFQLHGKSPIPETRHQQILNTVLELDALPFIDGLNMVFLPGSVLIHVETRWKFFEFRPSEEVISKISISETTLADMNRLLSIVSAASNSFETSLPDSG